MNQKPSPISVHTLQEEEQVWDVVIIGGGLAGLTAAIYLARAGLKVLIQEKKKHIGGRAATENKQGCYVNLGAHALYKKGVGMKILKQLGVKPSGKPPAFQGEIIIEGEALRVSNPLSIITHSHLSWRAKKEFISFYLKLSKVDISTLHQISFQSWLEQQVQDLAVRGIIRTLAMLGTYCKNLELMSAAAAIQQLQLGQVIYVDHGWQTIVEELRKRAIAAGATIQSQTAVASISGHYPEMKIALANQQVLTARQVLATSSPNELLKLLDGHEELESIQARFQQLKPVKVACLDLALREVPQPNHAFGLSLDQSIYFSNHSKGAILAEQKGHSVIHLLKYLDVNEGDASEQGHQTENRTEQELEEFLNYFQPGWESQLITRRYMPNVTVTHAFPTATTGGLTGRPKSRLKEVPGLFIAGDWVGEVGLLADAAFASAVEAALSMISESFNVNPSVSLSISPGISQV